MYTKCAAFIASRSVRPCFTPSFNVCPANAAPSIRLAVAPAPVVAIPVCIKPLAANEELYFFIPKDEAPFAIAFDDFKNFAPFVTADIPLAAYVAGTINDNANGIIRATPVAQKSASAKSSHVTFSKSFKPGTSSPNECK